MESDPKNSRLVFVICLLITSIFFCSIFYLDRPEDFLTNMWLWYVGMSSIFSFIVWFGVESIRLYSYYEKKLKQLPFEQQMKFAIQESEYIHSELLKLLIPKVFSNAYHKIRYFFTK